MKKILILQVALSIFLSSLVFANSNADSERTVCLGDSLKKGSFTFSTAYLEGQYIDKQLAGFYLDLTMPLIEQLWKLLILSCLRKCLRWI